MTQAIVFDTETTGLCKPLGNKLETQPKIIEICCIKLDEDLNEIGAFETFINPQEQLEKVITDITGITDNDVMAAPTFASIYGDLAEFFLGVEMLVAHNLAFDRSLLSFELERMDRLRNFPWPIHHICTVNKSMNLEGHRLSLDKLYKIATGKEHTKAHRARGDVEATIECFTFLAEEGMI